VIHEGAVAVEDDGIVAVGPTESLERQYDAAERIDASGQFVLPGLINPHTHVSDILLRGCWGGDRGLLDWLYNVKRPGVAAMNATDHAAAAELYAVEAIRAGVTAFVENDAELTPHDHEAVGAKLDAYDRAGIRNVYASGLIDEPSDGEARDHHHRITAKEPAVNHPDPGANVVDTAAGIDAIASRIDRYHGSAGGRQAVWIAPVAPASVTTEGFRRAAALATDSGVMTTTHVAETRGKAGGGAVSPVEYLSNVGYLGEHTLLGHCTHVSERDIRILARTGTSVSHNLLANLYLGSGLAPVRELRREGVTTALSTDNPSCNDGVNPLADARFAALVHDGAHEDPGRLSAQDALDMVTRDAARAIGRGDRLGALEAGRRADILLLDASGPHMSPVADPVSALVHQARGDEISTVLCDGEFLLRDGELESLDEPAVLERSRAAAGVVRERAGLTGLGDGT
jgi:atrazine chlorohydrolase/5-methylthioadenosine/S-adenosylhomocysteine deaminase